MDDSKKIFREERLAMMYRIIQEKHKVFVVDLAEQFNISESSVRLDLQMAWPPPCGLPGAPVRWP